MSQSLTAVFKLEGDSAGLQRAAEGAAGKLESLKEEINADNKAIAGMQRALKNLSGAQVVNIKQVSALKNAIVEKKNAVAVAQRAFIAYGGAFADVGKKTNSFRDRMAALESAVSQAPGPLKNAAGGISIIGRALTAHPIAGIVIGIAAAFTAVAAGALMATKSLLSYAVASQDAERSEQLHLEGLVKIRTWYKTAAMSAADLSEAIDSVSATTPLPKDKVSAYAQELYRAGVRGQNLSDALEGVAIKASVQGDAAAGAFKEVAVSVALAGGKVKKFTQFVKNDLGGIAQRQMLSLEVQTAKLKESFTVLFSGINIEPFLRAKAMLFSMFSQATAQGRALKAVLGAVLQPLINASETGAVTVKDIFRGMVLGAQEVTIAFLRAKLWIKKALGDGEVMSASTKLAAAITVGKVAVYGLIGVLGLGAIAIGAIALSITSMATVIAAPFALLIGLGTLAVKAVTAVKDAFGSVQWAQIGSNIVSGIWQGFKDSWGAFRDGMKYAAGEVKTWFSDALQIHSPSRVFADLGRQIPAGLALGVDAGAGAARSAAQELADSVSAIKVAPPDTSALATAAANARGAADMLASTFSSMDWGALGRSVGEGLLEGLRSGLAAVARTGASLVESTQRAIGAGDLAGGQFAGDGQNEAKRTVEIKRTVSNLIELPSKKIEVPPLEAPTLPALQVAAQAPLAVDKGPLAVAAQPPLTVERPTLQSVALEAPELPKLQLAAQTPLAVERPVLQVAAQPPLAVSVPKLEAPDLKQFSRVTVPQVDPASIKPENTQETVTDSATSKRSASSGNTIELKIGEINITTASDNAKGIATAVAAELKRILGELNLQRGGAV